jgi:CubicO group peptidase (beta-lactamase class C family)
MFQRLIKTLFISSFLIASTSCSLNGKDPKPASPDGEPRFGKVNIQYTDTTLPATKQLIYRLDTFYKRQISAGFNGSVLIGYKGKVLYERYFGLSQKESGAQWSPQTQSQLASTTKTLTSGAILLLKDKGLLDLDDPVMKYLANFPYPDITIRMLLNHRSGLPDYIKFVGKPIGKMFYSNDDILAIFATKKPKLNFTPNTKFTYSNSNFAMLASVVESISGMKFDYFMRRFVFTPLGMDCTFVFNPEKDMECTTSFCYNNNWALEPNMHFDGVMGDKGIYSSVRDLYKWDQALYSGKLIKQSTLEEAFKPYSFEKPGVKNYGLGWRMLNYPDGVKIIYHNGWWHGNNTCFYRFIQDNFTIIVLGNKFNKSIYRQPQQIYNIVMGVADKSTELDTEE